ncbi:hypothetical protein [Mycolicibacterium agri]|nr:hypothetical protein [Mycolicibacterium agri]
MIHTELLKGALEGSDTAPDAIVEADATGNSKDRGAANKEAAKYRARLRDAEAKRDELTERLATLQRGQAETLAREYLADPSDLWRDGIELTALLDDDGNLDPARVAEVAQETVAAHRHWAAQRPPKRNPAGSGGGFKSGATGTDNYRQAPSWHKVLNTTRGDA